MTSRMLVTVLLLCTARVSINAQPTTLAAGDLAFTGINSSSSTVNGTGTNKDFCFVLLRNITAGTTIFFTDYGWRTDQQAFQTANPCPNNGNPLGSGALTDGIVKWVAATDLPYGTQVVIRSQFTPSASVGTATGEAKTYNSSSASPQYVTLGLGGETIFAYQGSFESPILIAGLNTYPSGWLPSLSNCDLEPVQSALPNVFNNASNFAFALTPGSNTTNVRLSPTVKIGTDAAAARAIIANRNNWQFQSTAMVLPGSASVLPVHFGRIDANLKNNQLRVNWQSLQEKNNDHFIVEVSADGKTFKEAGIVQSRAIDGNSDVTLQYSFELTAPGLAGAVTLLGLLSFAFRRKKYMLTAATGLLLLAVVSCSRNSGAIEEEHQTLFIRIGQVDKDGTMTYSKTIRVHTAP